MTEKINITKAVTQMCSAKKVFLKLSQNSQENTCVRVSFLVKLQALDSGILFSCEFCEIFKNTFFHRTPLVAASDNLKNFKNVHLTKEMKYLLKP